MALFSFVGLLWTTVVLSRQRKLEQQSMYAEMNRKYYESMEQQHFEIRRMRHDMANYLQTLSVLPEKEKEEYIGIFWIIRRLFVIYTTAEILQ